MKVYISGAITGTDDHAERFEEAEKYLLSQGHQVINPDKIGHELLKSIPWIKYDDFIELDKIFIKMCDAVYFLKHYENSNGARYEMMYAIRLGKGIMYQEGDYGEAEFIEQMGLVDFFTYERKQFMAEVAQAIELWIKGNCAIKRNDKNGGENADG